MYLRKILFIALLSLFFIFAFSYGVYKALPIILGPKIEISTPGDNYIAEGTTIPVRGTVVRVKTLHINGINTPFTESGSFETKLAIYPGGNILIIEGTDRFGRTNTITRNIATKN